LTVDGDTLGTKKKKRKKNLSHILTYYWILITLNLHKFRWKIPIAHLKIGRSGRNDERDIKKEEK